MKPPPVLKSRERREYRKWKLAMQDWTFTTDIERERWGAEVAQRVELEEAQDILEMMDRAVLHTADGYDKLLEEFDQEFLGEKKDELWTIFAETVLAGDRSDGMGIRDFTRGYNQKLRKLDAELSTPLPSELQGLLTAHEAGLKESQVQSLLTATGLSWERERVVKAIKTQFEKMQTTATTKRNEHHHHRGTKVYAVQEEQSPPTSGDDGGGQATEQDLESVGPSEMEVLYTNYSQAKKLFQQKRKSRGFYVSTDRYRNKLEKKVGPPPDPSKTEPRPPRREVPPNSRCGRCGEKGHWKNECPNPYKASGARYKGAGISKVGLTYFLADHRSIDAAGHACSSVFVVHVCEDQPRYH